MEANNTLQLYYSSTQKEQKTAGLTDPDLTQSTYFSLFPWAGRQEAQLGIYHAKHYYFAHNGCATLRELESFEMDAASAAVSSSPVGRVVESFQSNSQRSRCTLLVTMLRE